MEWNAGVLGGFGEKGGKAVIFTYIGSPRSWAVFDVLGTQRVISVTPSWRRDVLLEYSVTG